MGEKGNGGHVATGGARAVRQSTGGDVGLGGSSLSGGASAAAGGGFLSSLADQASDHITDAGGAVVEKAHESHNED
jgi:hypothetical protein